MRHVPPPSKLTCLALLLPALFASTLHAAVPTPEQALGDDFNIWFQSQVRDEKVLGAAFAVVSSAGVVRMGAAGYTDTTRKKSIDADTAFRLASVSKTFAAEVTAQLVRDGQLRWEDPVTLYVPDFRIKGDASRIQIAHLLGQSSGLVPHAYDNLIEAGVSADEIRKRLATLSSVCTPGECYSYQNSVFSLIEPVVEKVSAQSYSQLVSQRIFKPLDMRTASVGYEAFLATTNRAEPHVKRNGQWKTVKVLPNYYSVAPAAGVNASVRDMSKWLMAQLGAYPQVVAPDMLGTLTTPRVRTPGDMHRKEWNRLLTDAHYGLGWRVYQLGNEQIAYHSGWVSGYRADIAWSARHNIGLVILMNVESSAINSLTTRFWELAFARLPAASVALSP